VTGGEKVSEKVLDGAELRGNVNSKVGTKKKAQLNVSVVKTDILHEGCPTN